MVNQCIDAHHHLWRYVPAEYPWMTGGMEILRRDFLMGDLKAVTAAATAGYGFDNMSYRLKRLWRMGISAARRASVLSALEGRRHMSASDAKQTPA